MVRLWFLVCGVWFLFAFEVPPEAIELAPQMQLPAPLASVSHRRGVRWTEFTFAVWDKVSPFKDFPKHHFQRPHTYHMQHNCPVSRLLRVRQRPSPLQHQTYFLSNNRSYLLITGVYQFLLAQRANWQQMLLLRVRFVGETLLLINMMSV